ncbi:hypothetical protein ANN_12657 [Periplaneta americana]|uniref:Uncharacterized protein n=1 Tax=Periplaneta americana TaxID=6978 RepID=A0ABQ8TIK9_PERAM|nr:hypothetical protein ANN_12657 [Periplaneta americana]
MSPGSSTESYPAFVRIGLRENPGKNLNQGMTIDPTIRCETYKGQPEDVHEEKRAIYVPTIPYYKDKYQLHDISVTGLMFGARGTIPNFTSQFCKTLGLHKSFLNELALLIIREQARKIVFKVYNYLKNVDEQNAAGHPDADCNVANAQETTAEACGVGLRNVQRILLVKEIGLFSDAVSTTRLFSVDEIGDSEMVFAEIRPRFDENHLHSPYGWGKPRKKLNQDPELTPVKTRELNTLFTLYTKKPPKERVHREWEEKQERKRYVKDRKVV